MLGAATHGGMEALQRELKGCKEKWGKEIELSKAEKGEPTYPFPVCVTRYTPQPESAQAWDCEEVPVRLVVLDADVTKRSVSVEVPPIFPGELSGLIEQAVESQWREMLAKEGDHVWQLDEIFEWIEAKFDYLLRLVPGYVDHYVGCDNAGASMRRYTLVGPAAEDDNSDDDAGDDEEEQDRRLREYIEREAARVEAEFEEQSKRAEDKRKMAEQGLFEDGEKAVQLTKAQKAEQNMSRKERSGQRWRKTGAKTNKPVREEGDKSLKGMPGQKKK